MESVNEPAFNSDSHVVRIKGEGLRPDDVVAVARYGARVEVTVDPTILRRMDASAAYINRTANAGDPTYGVTSGFGGMANMVIGPNQASALQTNLIRFMKSGAGERLPDEDVRAAMLLRANSHLKGASGIRREIVERVVLFLNERVTPHVRTLGSIGASGDLTPLANIAGAVFGLDPCYRVDFRGGEMDCKTALERLGLKPLTPRPKRSPS